jgi:hypothetical protein
MRTEVSCDVGLDVPGGLAVGLSDVAILLARWPPLTASRRKSIGWVIVATCAIGFMPFLHDWNRLGLALH